MNAIRWFLVAAAIPFLACLALAKEVPSTSGARPRVSIGINDSRESRVRQGWPLMIRVRLLHPDMMHFDTSDTPITIAAPTSPWSNALSIEVRNELGVLQNWSPQADAGGLGSTLTLDSVTSGFTSWIVSPEQSALIPLGTYNILATLDTRAVLDPFAWKGIARSVPGTLIVDADSQSLPADEDSYKNRLLAAYEIWHGEPSAALARLDSFLVLHPNDVSVLEMTGDELSSSGNPGEALQAYNRALKEFGAQTPGPPSPPMEMLIERNQLFEGMLTSVETGPASSLLPAVPGLSQNYPNPFNPSTTVRYQLPFAGKITLRIFDILGRQVTSLLDGTQEAGYQSVEWNAGEFPSGIYFYRLDVAEVIHPSHRYTSVKKMLLVK